MPDKDTSTGSSLSGGNGTPHKQCGDEAVSPGEASLTAASHDIPRMKRAVRGCLEGGRLAEAESLLRQLHDLRPHDSDVLRMMGEASYRAKRPAEAFALFLRALDGGTWPDEAMLSSMGPVLEAVFVGKTYGLAASLRVAYDGRGAERPLHPASHAPLVSVVLAASGVADGLGAALDSVLAQTHVPLEIVLVTDGGAPLPPPGAPDGVPVRHVRQTQGGLASLINAGVRHARGEFISLLTPGDRYDARRVERMVDAVARNGCEWGFSGFGLAPSPGLAAEFLERRGREIADLLDSIRGYDTTGYALLDCLDVLALHSNLFFSRTLFDAVGGFADLAEGAHRDFALRALLQAEPGYVHEALLHCRIAQVSPEQAKAQLEAIHAALRGFYAKAVADDRPANGFAPALSVWGDHFIARLAAGRRLHLLPREGMRKCMERASARVARYLSAAPEKRPGIDLVSFFGAQIGLADSARGIVRSCRAGGIPCSARTVELELPQMRGDRSMDPWLEDSCNHAAVVLHVNPDTLAGILPQLTAAEVSNRRLIGYWYWETERMPEQWRYALDFLDEIWVATEFVAEAARRFTGKPVVKIRPPVDVPPCQPHARAAFGLDEKPFLFLFSFDFNSHITRKNPYAAIQAFMQAFPPGRRDVGLVVKSHGGARQPDKLRELAAMIEGDTRIRLIDRRMTRGEMYALQSVCDAYVSLHRSEGLGLGLAECMAQGKAVIGTAYSGNLEFMNGGNSCLVDCRLIPLGAGDYAHDQPGVSWAEPDIENAAWWMRRLVDDRDFYARIASAGQAEIRQHWNLQSTAEAVRRRLGELGLL